MSNPITVKGYVCSVPRAADARQASVAVVQDDVEYRIIPRGAGADLADEELAPRLAEYRRQAQEPAQPARLCPYCRMEVAPDATRCPHCTAELPAPAEVTIEIVKK